MMTNMIEVFKLPAGKISSRIKFNPKTKKNNKIVTLMYRASELYIDDMYVIHNNLKTRNAVGIDMQFSGKLSAKPIVKITSVFE